jgi:hypothetical protein
MMAEMMREIRTAVIWAAFGLGLFWATLPVWSYLLFGPGLTLADLLSLRCLGSPS